MWDRPAGCAVVLSNVEMGEVRMFFGELHKGEKWTDVLGWEQAEVEIGEDGFGVFTVGGCSASVWVRHDAKGRDKFGKFDNQIY
jgi:alpha-amylase